MRDDKRAEKNAAAQDGFSKRWNAGGPLFPDLGNRTRRAARANR
jgi:hypothetical protein